MRLEDTKFIVTGGAQGMGRHFALRLAEAGAQVATGDVNEAGLAALAARQGPGQGPRAQAQRRRRGRRRRVRRLGARGDGRAQRPRQQRRHPPRRPPREAGPETGAIKKLSQASSGTPSSPSTSPAPRSSRATWSRRWPRPAHAPGVVVNMSSIARHGNRGQSNYSAAKAALAANTMTWSLEFAPVRHPRGRRRARA